MNDPNINALDTVAWYKQFWPWLLIVLLSVSVITSLIFVYVAVKNQDPVIDGNYYQHGLTINEQLDKIPSVAPAQHLATPTQDEKR